MSNFKVAVQLYSLRKDMESDFEGTLKAVKSLCYDGVEFAGLFGKNAAQVKKICEKTELIPVSAHVPFAEMAANPNVLRDYAEIGCEYIVIPAIAAEYRPGNEKFGEFTELTKSLAKEARELGMKLCYHNHDFEFQKTDGKYGFDMIYDAVPEDLLEMQLDTCWAEAAGADPCELLRKYKDRTSIIHLKDHAGKIDGDGAERFELRPLGRGIINFAAIIDTAKEVHAEWLVVEQDNPSLGKTPLECAEMSINYLKGLI